MPLGPIETVFFQRLLKPGDVLLYRHHGIFNFLIERVTHAPVSHCELYLGNLKTVASRNGLGVAVYDFYMDDIALVLRPVAPFNLADAKAYIETVVGQAYDWTGLWRSFAENNWGRNTTKQWCSENTTNVLRAGHVEPFDPSIPSDMVSPGDLYKSAAFTRLWTARNFKP